MPKSGFFKKFKSFFTQGASPKALAASSTIGVVMGIFPVIGVTTLMMGAISVRWKLNLPLMLAVSYLIYPLQIVLMIPFVRVGEWLTGSKYVSFSFEKMGQAFEADFMGALADLGTANLQAVAGWGLFSIPAAAGMYLLLIPIYSKIIGRTKLVEANYGQ